MLEMTNGKYRHPPRSLRIYKAKRGWKQVPHHSVMQRSQIMGNDFCSLGRNPLEAQVWLLFPQAALDPQWRSKQAEALERPSSL